MKTAQIKVTMEPELYEDLQKAAAILGISFAGLIRMWGTTKLREHKQEYPEFWKE